MWPGKVAHILFDELSGLGSAPIMYDSKLDDGYCTISLGNGLSTTVTKLGHPRTALTAQIANLG